MLFHQKNINKQNIIVIALSILLTISVISNIFFYNDKNRLERLYREEIYIQVEDMQKNTKLLKQEVIEVIATSTISNGQAIKIRQIADGLYKNKVRLSNYARNYYKKSPIILVQPVYDIFNQILMYTDYLQKITYSMGSQEMTLSKDDIDSLKIIFDIGSDITLIYDNYTKMSREPSHMKAILMSNFEWINILNQLGNLADKKYSNLADTFTNFN